MHVICSALSEDLTMLSTITLRGSFVLVLTLALAYTFYTFIIPQNPHILYSIA